MPVNPSAPYSTGAQILELVQDLCNDQQGQLFTASFCLPAINSAARWMGDELRNRGKMTLVEDEFIVTIPKVLVNDPMQQVNLMFTGISGNLVAANAPALPETMIEPLVLHERPTPIGNAAGQRPIEMKNWTGNGGLPREHAQFRLRYWEWRTDMICFIGALVDTDIVIRFSAVPFIFSLTSDNPPLISGSLGDIEGIDACAYYAASQLVPKRGGAALGAQYKAEAQARLEQLSTDVTRQEQFAPVRMRPYGRSYGRGNGSRRYS